MMNIAILFGGESGEHEISTLSAYSVYCNIDRSQFSPLLIGITQSGEWFLQREVKMSNRALYIDCNEENRVFLSPGVGLFCNHKKLEIDFLFPVLHGTYGEDGTVQGLFDLLHLPYAGSGVIGSAVGMDKVLAKRIWKAIGIPVVPFVELTLSQWEAKKDHSEVKESLFNQIEEELSFPLFVKPVNAGSSVGASKAKNKIELERAIQEAFLYDSRLLIERFIVAREIECALLGNENPQVFAPGEIKATHEFYDYDAKYNDPKGATLEITAQLDEKTRTTIQSYAKRGYEAINAKGFARVDFFLDKKNNAIYLNEINTLPGFTSISMFPKMCEAGNLPYQQLITNIIQLGVEHFTLKRNLVSHFTRCMLKD